MPADANMIDIMLEQTIDLFRRSAPVARELEGGAFLFHAGDPVGVLHLVEVGEVRLLRRQVDGTSLILQRAHAGSLVAEASLASDHYHCDAIAVRPSRLRAVAKPALLAAMADDQGLARAWLAGHDGRLPEKGTWRSLAGEIGVSPEALYRELGKRQRGFDPLGCRRPTLLDTMIRRRQLSARNASPHLGTSRHVIWWG